MATYYVRPGGNDSNTGTGPASNQAWLTIQKALGATSGLVGGDIVYVAPGHYLEQVTIGITSPSSTVQIIGDVTASQFTGLSAGFVRLSGYTAAGNIAPTYTGYVLRGTSKNNLSFSNFIFEGQGQGTVGQALVYFATSQNLTFTKCLFSQQGYSGGTTGATCLDLYAPTSSALNAIISKCIFESGAIVCAVNGNNVSDTSSIKDCLFFGGRYQIVIVSCQAVIQNCTFNGAYQNSILISAGSSTFKSQIRNNLFLFCINAIQSSSTLAQDEDYNRIIGASTARTNVTAGTNSLVVGSSRLSYGYSRMVGLSATDFWSPEQNSPNQGFGTATGAEATDVYSTAWTGATPDAGYQTFSVSSTLSPTYNPTERNASTITIAPGSTSQSIELYLGVTGLTASTTGLSARYNRTRTASVDIPLVARTIAQAWTSGGFAEVDATNMPGVYRLDVPDAALAAGADDVTIVVRGASGTNGAVMTVKLSSGGLTSAQTAAAVWDEPYTSHTSANSFGARTLLTTADNRPAAVGTSNHIQSNVHAIVDSTAAASELSGALLHNGTDYISADLLTPVSAATSVHIGPYQLLADGLGADQPLDVNVGTATSIDVQVTDANGTGIDITGATVSAKVYNSGGTLVATYAGTATYADNGRLSFGLTTTVTATSGTYTVTVTSTTGASDTQIFGPLRLYVRPV